MIVDPHTAVGLAAARRETCSGNADGRAVDGACRQVSGSQSSAPPAACPSSPSGSRRSSASTSAAPCLPNDYATVADFIASRARTLGKTAGARGRRAGVGA